MYATNYIRNSKAIAVLWGIFTICYAIITVVAFVTPGKFAIVVMKVRRLMKSFVFPPTEWVGDLDDDVGGRLGLWQICQKDESTDNCSGSLEDLMSMPSVAFQVSVCTFFLY
jgi:LHFPL tetraspan subfamily member protein